MALGTIPVSPSLLENAYASLAQAEYKPLCPVKSIQNLLGENLPNPCRENEVKPLNKNTSFMVADMLQNVSARPGNWHENLAPKGSQFAIKTGTYSKRVNYQVVLVDNVVVGMTPEVTILLWAGNTDGRALNFGSVAVDSIGPVWKQIAQRVLDKYPNLSGEFKAPEGLKRVQGEWAEETYKNKPYPEIWFQLILIIIEYQKILN